MLLILPVLSTHNFAQKKPKKTQIGSNLHPSSRPRISNRPNINKRVPKSRDRAVTPLSTYTIPNTRQPAAKYTASSPLPSTYFTS